MMAIHFISRGRVLVLVRAEDIETAEGGSAASGRGSFKADAAAFAAFTAAAIDKRKKEQRRSRFASQPASVAPERCMPRCPHRRTPPTHQPLQYSNPLAPALLRLSSTYQVNPGSPPAPSSPSSAPAHVTRAFQPSPLDLSSSCSSLLPAACD